MEFKMVIRKTQDALMGLCIYSTAGLAQALTTNTCILNNHSVKCIFSGPYELKGMPGHSPNSVYIGASHCPTI